MKTILRLSFMLVITAGIFTSCKKSSPKQTKHIPKSALLVATVNMDALEDKLVKSQATLDNIFKALSQNDTAMAKGKEKWAELKNAGISFDDNMYIAMVQKGGSLTGGKGTMVISALATLKDGSKLEAYIKKEKPDAEIKKEKEYSYAVTEGSNMVAWGNDMVIMMHYEKSFANNMEYDSLTGEYNFNTPVQDDADLKAEMASYFSMKEGDAVASVPEFRELMQEKADASMWVNSSSSMESMPIQLPKVKELFENNYTAATINFEDGKIVMDSKSYTSAALRDMFKKYPSPKTDLSLIETYPSSNINGFASLSFNPELISAIIKYLEVGGMIDGFMTNMMGANYTYNDMVKILKGDIAVVMSDFKMPEPNAEGMTEENGAPFKFLMNMPVGDAAQMNKLMDKLVEKQMITKVNGEYKLIPSIAMLGFHLSADGKNIIIASDSLLATQYKAKTGKASLGSDVTKDFNGKNMVMYVNIESILNGIPMNPNEKEMMALMPKAKETFKDMKGYSEYNNGKYTEGHFEFRMKNEKQNSLTSLLEFFGVAVETMQKASADRSKMWDELDEQKDTTFTMPN